MATQDSSLGLSLGPVDLPARVPSVAKPATGEKASREGSAPSQVFDLTSQAPLPQLPERSLPTLEEFESQRAAEPTPSRTRGGMWFAGDALMCACPDCQAPMTIRTFLMVADCWNCATSIELDEQMEREARQMLADRDRKPVAGKTAPETPQAKVDSTAAKSTAAATNGAARGGPTGERRAPAQSPPKRDPSARPTSTAAPPVAAPPVGAPRKESTTPSPAQASPARPPEAKQRPAPAPGGSSPGGSSPGGSALGGSAPSPARRERTPAAVANTRRRIRRLTAASMVRAWLSDLFGMTPAWLISAVLHFVVLAILALITIPDDDDQKIVLSTSLSVDREGGEVVHLDPQDEAEFDLPVPDKLDLKDPDVKQALLVAEQEARELRLDPDAVEPLLPQLSDVKNQIGSATARKSLAARDPRVRVEMVEREGGTTLTEAAVARALRWLASQQNDDGGWSLRGGGASDEAATSLALLPFLGAGQTHLNGVYKDHVAGGLRWLVDHQRENGDLRYRLQSGNHGMYAHGQGTIVLCEAFAMEGDEKLRVPAQKAVDFIVAAQHQGGGWRYQPGQPGDTSVLGWQLMALQSARVAGLTTPESTFALADQFLDSVQAKKYRRAANGYAYQRGRPPSRAMTAEALLCRMYNGWTEQNPDLEEDVAWLAENHLPDDRQPEMYYWYYGTQVFHHVGGLRWEQWNDRMRDILVLSQDRRGADAGSWPTRGGHDSAGGRIYTTSLAACTLEVYYRHLPIFRQIKLD
ncbi:MAG: prenyltransferase/squalene oxidase repeat-containing protein [Pirellulaceae bacterium]